MKVTRALWARKRIYSGPPSEHKGRARTIVSDTEVLGKYQEVFDNQDNERVKRDFTQIFVANICGFTDGTKDKIRPRMDYNDNTFILSISGDAENTDTQRVAWCTIAIDALKQVGINTKKLIPRRPGFIEKSILFPGVVLLTRKKMFSENKFLAILREAREACAKIK
jgi:hypothetical protein